MDDPRNREFEQLVVRYQDAVCAVAYSLLRDRARSEEVAQEAFLIAWQKLPAMTPPPKLPGWICGISRNLAANASRRKKEILMDPESLSSPVSDGTPLTALLDRESKDRALAALAELSDRDREVVTLYYRLEDPTGAPASTRSIAAGLGVTEATARQRLHRGRDRLRAALAAVETTLRATRPGPAFTVACVAALAAGGTTPSDAATASAKPGLAVGWLAVPAIAIAVAGGAWAFARAIERSDVDPSTPTIGATAGSSAPRLAFARTIDATERAAVLGRIRGAREARQLATGGRAGGLRDATPNLKIYDFAGTPLDDLALPPSSLRRDVLDKAALRYAIKSAQPLVLECYVAARGRLAKPDGTITVVVRLTGEPGVATLVESTKLEGDPQFLADPDLVECIQESLMPVELPPMAEGGSIEVSYPFTIAHPS